MGYKVDWLKGVFPALVTPFNRDNSIDEMALRDLIRFVLPHVDGVVPCGTTGEFVYMSQDERRRVVEICLDEADGRVPVLAGTGCNSTRDTVKQTQFAKEAGVDGALVVAPWYLKASYNEVYDHFRQVDAIGLPLVMYNIPQCAGTHFMWWTAEGGLLDLESTVGIKDSSGDMPFMEALFEKVKGRVSIMVGNDEIVQPALASGADGAILGSANLIADIWQEVFRASVNHAEERARELQQCVQKLVRIIVRNGPSQACKEGLGMMGMNVGNCRRPIAPGGIFRREDREELRLALESLGKLPKRTITYDLGSKKIDTEVFATPATPDVVSDFTLRVGEGFAGPPMQELAHVDLLIGMVDGPVGRAIQRSINEPSGKTGLQIICDEPKTLLVPTITMRTKRQEELFMRAASGVKLAITHSVEDGFLPIALRKEIALIVNAFVHSAASIGQRVEFNNYKATRHAIRKAIEGRPALEECIAEKDSARHPFRYAP